ncbi:hypothetical protein D9M68_755010 [compost metagenome]
MSKTPTAKLARTTASSVQPVARGDVAVVPESAPKAESRPPRLGELVHVVVAEGVLLKNNETGGYFAASVRTPQAVTVTTLRRLKDGDLQLA